MASSAADAKVHQKAWLDSSIAEKYKRGENATKPFADVLVQKSGLTKSEAEAGNYVLDIAAGTGAVEAAIYSALPEEKWDTLKVLGTDISGPMLEYLKARAETEGWKGVETAIVDGHDIKLPPNTYTHIFVNFGIFMLPPTALPTCLSLLRPEGFIGITTWSDLPWIPLVARAIARLPTPRPYCPTAAEIETKIYNGRAWNTPAYVAAQLREAGFEKVQTQEEVRDVEVGTPEQFMLPMAMPLAMVSTWWAEAEREKVLGDVQREMLEVVREDVERGDGRMRFSGILGMGWKGV
ncbi:S-adenosyl-L-methionine-dependent methyltransferase [Melanomma pulvis-pyrius CBS 109.77]|uniref:S-adenosyl-L-methionine-dependent methyltransferase n=1 Tax=Melanomma pulvis-pyrius CBS 109.77 TaxID=1314802 RepID=A0A6A6XFJ2_9PLEO|nr:S-adenosyl-L-methionine-dependent methyltransferase [Melanomma pulvis-pyrius CBS 109.77]